MATEVRAALIGSAAPRASSGRSERRSAMATLDEMVPVARRVMADNGTQWTCARSPCECPAIPMRGVTNQHDDALPCPLVEL